MTTLKEIGRVGGWRYAVAASGDQFEVLRQDIRFDQVEEFLAEAPTFKAAVRKAAFAMVQEIKRKKRMVTANSANARIGDQNLETLPASVNVRRR
jgi:hypothetical protein